MAKQIVCGKLYASWCHYCKDLQGPWAELLSHLNRDSTLVCTVKDIPLGDENDETKRQNMLDTLKKQLNANQNINVQGGYPTIFKLDDHQNVVYYDGNRTVDGMYQFFTGRPLKRHPRRNIGVKEPRANSLTKQKTNRKKKNNNNNNNNKAWTTRRGRQTRRKPRKF